MEQKAKWHDLGDGICVRVVEADLSGNLEEDCDRLILDWKGVEENGKVLPYSKENALYILKKYPDFAMYINELVHDARNELVIDTWLALKCQAMGVDFNDKND